jgi:hypothetical protein
MKDLSYTVNNTHLLAVNRRIRDEALPVLYGQTKFRVTGLNMLRDLLNTATMTNYAHLHIRRVSIVPWKYILNSCSPQRLFAVEQGSCIAIAIADLPSIREIELGDQFLPTNKSDYENEEWLNLMSTLHSNGGCLKVVAASLQTGWWATDWHSIGGRNFGWCERVLLRTVVEIRTWEELVEGDWGNFGFSEVFDEAMNENWTRGPLKNADVAVVGRRWKVRIWGVPENVRKSEERKEVRRKAKAAYREQRMRDGRRKGVNAAELSFDSDEDVDGSSGLGSETRHRKTVTREEARAKRMEKQRGLR